MNKKDILKLSQKTEEEQLLILHGAGIRQTRRGDSYDMDYIDMWESLPDLADRLWNSVVGTVSFEILETCIVDVFKARGGKNVHNKEIAKDWFLYFALPIHRIQAALLAKEGK